MYATKVDTGENPTEGTATCTLSTVGTSLQNLSDSNDEALMSNAFYWTSTGGTQSESHGAYRIGFHDKVDAGNGHASIFLCFCLFTKLYEFFILCHVDLIFAVNCRKTLVALRRTT